MCSDDARSCEICGAKLGFGNKVLFRNACNQCYSNRCFICRKMGVSNLVIGRLIRIGACAHHHKLAYIILTVPLY
jgi:hypothetical protein